MRYTCGNADGERASVMKQHLGIASLLEQHLGFCRPHPLLFAGGRFMCRTWLMGFQWERGNKSTKKSRKPYIDVKGVRVPHSIDVAEAFVKETR